MYFRFIISCVLFCHLLIVGGGDRSANGADVQTTSPPTSPPVPSPTQPPKQTQKDSRNDEGETASLQVLEQLLDKYQELEDNIREAMIAYCDASQSVRDCQAQFYDLLGDTSIEEVVNWGSTLNAKMKEDDANAKMKEDDVFAKFDHKKKVTLSQWSRLIALKKRAETFARLIENHQNSRVLEKLFDRIVDTMTRLEMGNYLSKKEVKEMLEPPNEDNEDKEKGDVATFSKSLEDQEIIDMLKTEMENRGRKPKSDTQPVDHTTEGGDENE